MKELESGSSITNFKALKYESKTAEEQKQIEDTLISKMGKWKYSPDQLTQQIPNALMDKIKPRWEHAMKNAKDIHQQTLRKLMPNFNDKEVKESLKKNEEKLTLRFNTCLILLKEIEHVVKNATNTWKNFYLPHNLSDFVVSVSDKDDDDDQEEKDEEKYDEEVTHFDNVDDEEAQENEATEEDVQDVEETNPVKIVVVVIASLPHSPSKTLITSNIKTTSARLIVTSTKSTNTQSVPTPVQLSTSLVVVPSTLSTKQQDLPST